MRKKADLLFTLCVLAIAIWAVWEARNWPLQTRLFPWTIGIPAIVLAAFQLKSALRTVVTSERPAEDPVAVPSRVATNGRTGLGDVGEIVASGPEGTDDVPPDIARQRTLEMSAWILLFFIGVLAFGFTLGSGILTLGFLRRAAAESWKLSLPVAFGVAAFFYLVFGFALNISLPSGWVGDILGIDSWEVPISNWLRMLVSGS